MSTNRRWYFYLLFTLSDDPKKGGGMKSLVNYDKSIKNARRGRPIIPTTPFGCMHGLFLPIFLLPMGKRDWSSPARPQRKSDRARAHVLGGRGSGGLGRLQPRRGECVRREGTRARKRAAEAVLLMENIQVALFPKWGIEIETVFST